MPNGPNNAPVSAQSAPSLEDLAIRSGIRSEHVLLQSEETLEPADERPQVVRKRFRLRNRIRGTETVLVLFDDGLLEVTEKRNGRLRRECALNLRYLEPRPRSSYRLAKTALATAFSLTALSLLMGLFAYFAVLPAVTLSVAVGSIVAASAALRVFLRRTEERIAFCTKHGRAIVLTMAANFGCFRACRKLARKLAAAIEEVRRQNDQEKQRLLRAEVREHYRLSEVGVLSAEACTAAVRRILAHFD